MFGLIHVASVRCINMLDKMTDIPYQMLLKERSRPFQSQSVRYEVENVFFSGRELNLVFSARRHFPLNYRLR